jgi:UDP-N-acetylglucosamine 2-epimerase (non-hydrolysing)
MFEETNRIVCDHVSSFLFVYHENYKQKLLNEGINKNKIFVVGNTIVEPLTKIADTSYIGKKSHILMDIHRPENFNHKDRLEKILKFATEYQKEFNCPVYMLRFARTMNKIMEFGLKIPDEIGIIDLLGYKKFIRLQQDSLFIFSDSGTAQEEPALLNIPVIVPRDFTERPESIENGDSYLLKLEYNKYIDSLKFLKQYSPTSKTWLGTGNTSQQIVDTLVNTL